MVSNDKDRSISRDLIRSSSRKSSLCSLELSESAFLKVKHIIGIL